MFVFSSFKCSPDVSVNICQRAAFGKQSYCWSPVPKRGGQQKQTRGSQSQLPFLSCSGEAVGVWVCVCTSKSRVNRCLWVAWVFTPGTLLIASLHPGGGPQPQGEKRMRYGSPICSLLAFAPRGKGLLGQARGALPANRPPWKIPGHGWLLLASQQKAYDSGSRLSCRQCKDLPRSEN